MVDSLHWSPHYASHFKVILECVLKKKSEFFFYKFLLFFALLLVWKSCVMLWANPMKILNHPWIGHSIPCTWSWVIVFALRSYLFVVFRDSCHRFVLVWKHSVVESATYKTGLILNAHRLFFSRLSASWSARTLLWTTSVVILSCGPGTWLMIQTEQGGYTKQSHFRKLV